MFKQTLIVAVTLVTLQSVCPAQQQPDPNSPRYKAAMAARTFLTGDQSPRDFAEQHLAKSLLDDKSHDASLKSLEKIKQAAHEYSVVGFGPEGEYAVMMELEDGSGNVRVAHFELESKPPHGFVRFWFDDGPRLGAGASDASPAESDEPLTWDNLEARLDQAGQDGFAGAVLIARGGEILLSKAYGLANQEKQIKNTTETIFAIGSTPIDFTKAGILLLAQRGELSLDDPISKYFSSVPDDKKAITITHLMTGGSGLRDFHDLPGDENPDHTWIDRAEAIKRILDHQLLFEPGKGREHSHSAWGLLAAIIEIVSKQSYQDFTTEHLFAPARMKDTGFFGQPYPEERIAVGYGRKSGTGVNSPPNWGPTSWLVMGSGGQVSTVGDMYRWLKALRNESILNKESQEAYFGPRSGGVLAGGDMFGFEILYTQGPETLMIICSNSIRQGVNRQDFNELGLALARLVNREVPGQGYTLGIQMSVEDEGVVIQEVMSGSAAQRDGLLAGDRLVSANGKAIGLDPLEVLGPLLQTGEPIEFDVDRAGERVKVVVKPAKAGGS